MSIATITTTRTCLEQQRVSVSEGCCCSGVRVFKWNPELSTDLIPPGFGIFTTLLRTRRSRIISSKGNPPRVQLSEFTFNPIPYNFTFDLRILSSPPRTFIRSLTSKFLVQLPQLTLETAQNMATKVADYVAKNFAYEEDVTVSQSDKSIPKILVVADFFHQLAPSYGMMNDDAENDGHNENSEFGAREILSNLRNYFGIPFLSFDRSPSNLTEVPGLEQFHGVEFSDMGEAEKEDTCAICLEGFSEEGKTAKKTNCCHLFHGECLARWLWRKPSCPLCRLSL